MVMGVDQGFPIPNPLNLFGDGIQTVVGLSASSILNGFSSWLADGASSLVTHVIHLIVDTSTTDLNPSSPGFFLPTGVMLQLTTVLVLPLLLVATIGAVLRQDLQRLVRTWFVALPGSMLAAGSAVALAGVGLQVTDALCRVVTTSVSPSLQTTFGNVAKTMTGPLLAGSPFLAALIALVFVLGGMSLWLELILRSAAIYLAVFFLPLALAGLVWPATAHWAKRMLETLAAVILSKLVVVVALSLAVRAVKDGATADDVLAGGAIFLLAAFAPFVLLRFTPLIEAAAISQLEGVSRRPVDAARSAGHKAANAPRTALGGLIFGHGTSSGSSPAGAPARAVAGFSVAAAGGQIDRAANGGGGGSPGDPGAGSPARDGSGAGVTPGGSVPGGSVPGGSGGSPAAGSPPVVGVGSSTSAPSSIGPPPASGGLPDD